MISTCSRRNKTKRHPDGIKRAENTPFKSDVVFVTFGALALFPITSFESQSTFDIFNYYIAE